MSTQEYTFKGKVLWAKVFPENREMFEWDTSTNSFSKPSPCNGKYMLSLVMDPNDFKELRMSGSIAAKHAKMDENGNDIIKLSRKHEAYNRDGELMEFASGAPEVVNASDVAWNFKEDGAIGNGSVCEVTISVYGNSPYIGTRLEKVKVIDHVAVEATPETHEVPF